MRRLWRLVILLLAPMVALAHVGSKDVFEQTTAGPYRLFVTIRMPDVIPGVARVEVRTSSVTDGGPAATAVKITPLPLTGEAAKHPPTADAMTRSAVDPAFFTGGLWMMAPGSWQIRFEVAGGAGEGTVAVPVPAVPVATLKMQRGMGTGLAGLGLFLVLSMAGIVAAAVREARLEPGATPGPSLRRRSVMVMAASLVVMALMVYGGAKWWDVEAADYSQQIYRPLKTEALLSGNALELKVSTFDSENRFRKRSNSDFIPDHGHLMHLYAIREPEMDAVYHLHPAMVGAGDLRLTLPAMPAGKYTLYGDVVHKSGFPETLLASVEVPEGMAGGRPGMDDAEGRPAGLGAGMLGTEYRLPDGYTMVWDRPATLTANAAYAFRFRLLGRDGQPAGDMQPYMGMAGHAAFVKTDGTVFAHVHPEGSAAMAAVMLANPPAPDAMADMPEMTGMSHPPGKVSPTESTVEFPYGFPTPGRYRIFVQMKHMTTVETGTFDAVVR